MNLRKPLQLQPINCVTSDRKSSSEQLIRQKPSAQILRSQQAATRQHTETPKGLLGKGRCGEPPHCPLRTEAFTPQLLIVVATESLRWDLLY